MDIRIKRLHPRAVIPAYAKPGDAGLDMTAVSRSFDEDGNVVYGTGLAFEIPEGFVGLLFPRSSLSRYGLAMANHVGVIDAGYRGEITVKFKPAFRFDPEDGIAADEKLYNIGDRVAQLVIMPVPRIDFTEAEELSRTERNTGSYGSTGK